MAKLRWANSIGSRLKETVTSLKELLRTICFKQMVEDLLPETYIDSNEEYMLCYITWLGTSDLKL